MKLKFKAILLAITYLVFLLIANQAVQAQATFDDTASGNWNAAGTWTMLSGADADGIPDSNDTVLIDSHTVTLDADSAADTVTISAGGTLSVTTNNLTLTVGSDLVVNGGNITATIGTSNFFTINAPNVNHTSGTITVNAAGLSNAEFNLLGTGTYILSTISSTNLIRLNIGNVSNIPSSVTINGALTSFSNLTIYSSGNITQAGNLSSQTIALRFSGASNYTYTAGTVSGAFNIYASSITVDTTADAEIDEIPATSLTLRAQGNIVINVPLGSSSFTALGLTTDDDNNGSGNISFGGSGSATLSNSGALSYQQTSSITYDSGAYPLGGLPNVTGCTTGALVLVSTANQVVITAATLGNSSISISANGAGNNIGNITAGSLTLNQKNIAPTYNFNAGSTTTLSAAFTTGAGATVNAGSSTITTSGGLSIIAGGIVNAGSSAIGVATSWSNNGTFNGDTSTVTLSGSSSTVTISMAAGSFNNLIIGAGATRRLLGATMTITVGGTFSQTGGIFQAQTRSLVVTGLATLSGGEYQPSTAKQTFNGGLTISGGTLTCSTGEVEVNGTLTISGSGTLTGLTGELDVNGNVALSGAGVLTAPSGAFGVSGDWTRTGGTFTPGANTVTLDGAGAQTISGTNIFNIVTLSTRVAGTVGFTGDTTAATVTVNGTGVYNVSFTGTTNTITNLVEFLNTGTVTLGDSSGDSITFNGGIETTGNATNPSGTNIAGALITSNDSITLGATTLTAAAALNSGGGTIAITSITGGGQDLTLAAGIGAGTTTISGAVSNLGDGAGASLTVANGVTGLVTFQSTFGGNSGIFADAGTSLRFDDNVTLANGDTATSLATVQLDGLDWSSFDDITFGATTLSTGAVGLNSNGDDVTFSSTLNGAQGLSIASGAGAINFNSTIGNSSALASLTIDNTAPSVANFNGATNAITGTFTKQGTGDINIGTNAFNAGGLTLTAGTINNDANDTGIWTIAGAVSIAGTLKATSGNLYVSGGWTNTGTFTAGSGTVIFNGAGAQTIANNHTFNAVTINTRAAGTVSFTGSATIPTLTVNGAGAYNVSFTGSTNVFTNLVEFLNTGTVTLGNGGFDNFMFNGGIETAGNASNPSSTITSTNIGDGLNASNNPMTLGPLTLAGTTGLNSNGQNISIASITGAYNLTLAGGVGAGTTTVTGAVTNLGTGTGACFTATGGAVTGLVTFQSTFSGNSGISGSTTPWRFNDNVTLANGNTATGLGSVQLDGLTWSSYDGITFIGAVTLSGGAVSINSNNGSVFFGSTVNGAQDLSVTSGTGNPATFTNTIGNLTPLSSLTINNTTPAIFNFNGATNAITGAFTKQGTGDINIGTNAFNAGGLTISAGTFNNAADDNGAWDINGAVTIAGTLKATSGTFNVSGNWDNNNTFTSGGGTLTLDGLTSTTFEAGASTYNNIQINKTDATDANDNVTFQTDAVTINGTLTITDGELIQQTALTTGAVTLSDASSKWTNITDNANVTLSGNIANTGTITFNAPTSDLIQIRSSASPTQRNWQGAGTFSMTDVDVKDQTCTGGTPANITVTDGTNNGNNINWLFGSSTVSGTVYSSIGGGNVGSGVVVTVAIYDTSTATRNYYTASTNGSGVYTITDGTIDTGDVVVAYLDGLANEASAVTKSNSNGASIANLHLYYNAVDVRDEGGGIANADLANLDSGIDDDIKYTVAAGNLTVTSGFDLYINSGDTFTPAGNVTVSNNWVNDGTFTPGANTVIFDGTTTISGASITSFNNVTINNTKSLTGPASGTMNVAGVWANSGTFNHNSATVKFDGSGAKTLETGGSAFSTATFDGAGSTWTLQTNNISAATMNVTTGTLDVGAARTITVSGTLTMNNGGAITNTASGTPNITITANTFTQNAGSSISTVVLSTGCIYINSTGARGPFTLGNMTLGSFGGAMYIGNTTAPTTISQTAGTTLNSPNQIFLNSSGDIGSAIAYIDISSGGLFVNATKNSGTGDIYLNGNNIAIGPFITADASSGDVYLKTTTSGSVTGNINSLYSLTIDSKGAVTINNYASSTVRFVNITAQAGAISSTSTNAIPLIITGNLSATGGAVSLSGYSTITQNTGTTISSSNSSVSLSASSDITTAGISSATTTTITSSGGSIWGNFLHTIACTTLTLSAGSAKDIGNGVTAKPLLINASAVTIADANSHPNIAISNAYATDVPLTVGAMTNAVATTIGYNKTLTLDALTISGGALTITATSTLNVNGAISTTSQNATLYGYPIIFGGSGSLTTNTSGSINLYGEGASNTLRTINSAGSLFFRIITTSATFTLGADVSAASNLTIFSGATLSAGSYTINVGGNWHNNGAFTAGSSTVALNGLTSTTFDAGASNYNNIQLNKTSGTDANDNVTFQTEAVTINGTLTITDGELIQQTALATGAVTLSDASSKWTNITDNANVTLSGNVANTGTITFNAPTSDLIQIRSSATPTQRNWQGAGTFSMTDVDVKDQTCTGGTPANITVSDGTNNGNNINWLFGSSTVSGTVYSSIGGGNVGSGVVVTVAIYDTSTATRNYYTASTNGSGVYTITDGTIDTGDVVVAYLDGLANEASAVTKSNSNGASIANLHLYYNAVDVRDEGGGIANADLANLDSGIDDDIKYTVAAGNLTVTSGFALLVNTGDTFTPVGNVTLTSANCQIEGILTLDGAYTLALNTSGTLTINGTINLDNNSSALDLAGALDLNGTLDATGFSPNINIAGAADFTGGTLAAGSSTFIFDGATTLTSDGEILNNVQIGSAGSAGTLTLADQADINGNLSVGNGGATTLNLGGQILLFSGSTFNLTNLDIFTEAGSNVTFDGAALQTVTSVSETYNTITVTNASVAGVVFADAFTAATLNAITPNTQLTFNAGDIYTITGVAGLNLDGQAAGTEVILVSDNPGTQFTFNVTGGVQTVDYVNVTDSAASTNNITANNSINNGGNDNADPIPHWIFGAVTRYWLGTTSADWNNSLNWSSTSGGAPGANPPSTNDTAIFDAGGNNPCTINITTVSLAVLDIQAGYTSKLDANGNDMTTTGNTTIADGELELDTNSQLTVGGTLSVSGGTLDGLNGTIDANSSVNINAGELIAPLGNFYVADDWTRSGGGIFTHSTGTVIFDTQANISIISGATTFYNFTCNTPYKEIDFTHSTIYTINNILTLNGQAKNTEIIAHSTSSGTGYTLDFPNGTQTITHVDLEDCTAGTSPSTARNSIDRSGNFNWTFQKTDPYGIVFDSISDNPIPAAIVTLYYDSDPGPGRTWIPAIPDSFLGAGDGQIDFTDLNPQTTGIDGAYSYNCIDGDFYIRVNAAGYTYPSTQVSFPAGRVIVIGSKGEIFTVAGVVIEMDQPLDSGGGTMPLKIKKDVNKKEIVIGDIVTYTVTITNETASDVTGVYLEDMIPAGFKYMEDRAILDNNSISDPTGNRPILFNIGTVSSGQTRTLKYQLIVGSGVTTGDYKNSAVCQYSDGTIISNRDSETVQVTLDQLFDLGTIIGKVFWDRNENGIQDNEEKPLGNVQIVTEDGTLITTDSDGKYHLPAIVPGRHILRINERTLPKDAYLTTDKVVIVDITPGLLAKANFGVNVKKSKIKNQKSNIQIKNENITNIRDASDNESSGEQLNELGDEQIDQPANPQPGKQANQKENDLLFVAIGDGKAGYNFNKGDMEPVEDSDRFRDGFWSEGKFAYYLKGKIKGKYLITSSLDTERDKPARQDLAGGKELFRKLDSDKYYPVYGDASTINYDATNTQGMLYLLIEWDKSKILWGNYITGLAETEFAQFNRTLYGGKVHLESVATTKFGEPNTKLIVFDAQIKQRASHNEFLGTGGSLYYLKDKYVIEGSEKVRIEIRDKITGLVLSSKQMSGGSDYEIDYDNGRIIFWQPVSQIAQSNSIISSSLLDGNLVYVVVDYEYETKDEYDQWTYGARLKQSLTDYLSVGGTYVKEQQPDKDYELKGLDATIHLGDNIKITAEQAQSISEQSENFISTNGGLSFTELPTADKDKGTAYGIKASADFDKWGLVGYYKKLNEGFSSSSTISQQGKELFGAGFVWDIGTQTKLALSHDVQKLSEDGNLQTQLQTGAGETKTSIAQLTHQVEKLKVTGEYKHQDVKDKLDQFEAQTNRNEDTVAVKADYQLTEKVGLSLEQQMTLKGETNNQTSIGLSAKPKENLLIKATQTAGTDGSATSVGLTAGAEDKNLHTTFAVADDAQEGQTQSVVVGSQQKLNDGFSLITDKTYAKNKETLTEANSFGLTKGNDGAKLKGTFTQQKLQNDKEFANTNIFGLSGDINNNWALAGSFEHGTVQNHDGTQATRNAGALGVGYINKDSLKASSKLEFRSDDGEEDKEQYLIYNAVEYKPTINATLFAKTNISGTENVTDNFTEAQYKELTAGFAYRPVYFDRLNMLAKYAYLEDNSSPGQTDFKDIEEERTHTVAGELAYDLTDKLQVVEKLAYKFGEEKVTGFDFTKTQTWLNIHRLNYNIDNNWQIGAEYRILTQKEAEDAKQGALVEVNRKIGQFVQLGAGYNFTEFNDDLTHLDYTSQGPFIRLTATLYDRTQEEIERARQKVLEENIKLWASQLIDEQLNNKTSPIMQKLNNYYNTAQKLQAEGKTREARELYEQITIIGQMLYNDAEEYVRQRIELEEKLQKDNELALQYYEQGRLQEAKQLLEKIIQDAEPNPIPWKY